MDYYVGWNEAHTRENTMITGVLLWDLSAAFDCLDCDTMCRKLKIYSLANKTITTSSRSLAYLLRVKL